MSAKAWLHDAAPALASAVLCAACLPPFDAWPLAVVSWVPLLVAASRRSPLAALRLGWLQGFASHLLVLWWFVPAVHEVGGFSLPSSVGVVLVGAGLQGGRSALLAALVARGAARGWPLLLVGPCALVASELVFPMLFPWTTALLANAQSRWLQLAEFGGPLLVSAWLALANAALAAAAASATLRARVAHTVGAAVLVAVVSVQGAARVRAVSRKIGNLPTSRIALVQGNLGPARHETQDPVEVYRSESIALIAREPKVDLLIWPETAIYYPTRETDLPRFFRDVGFRDRRDGATGRRIDVPVLSGMVVAARDGNQFNGAVLVDPSARVLGVYRKQRLVLFGEGWASAAPAAVVGAMDPRGILRFGAHRLMLSICYEDVFPGSFNGAVAAGAPDLLVNLTSDAWFGRSPASRLHLAAASLRAIEHRRFLVRATTTGGSVTIDPTGRVIFDLPANERAAGVATVAWISTHTLYESVGDAFGVTFAVAMVAVALLRRPREAAAYRPDAGA